MIDKYMSDPITSQLNFDMYIAENELNTRLAIVDSKAAKNSINESYRVLNEAFFDVIKEYINKVTQAITTAWNKFKAIIVDARITKLIADNRQALSTNFSMLLPDNFERPDIKAFDKMISDIMNNGNDYIFNTAAYNGWKQNKYLDTPEAFIKNVIKLDVGDNKSVADVFHDTVFKKVDAQNNTINNQDVQECVEFLTDYKNYIDMVAKDLQGVNTSNKNIETSLKTLTAATENAYIGNRLNTLLEAEQPNGAQQSTGSQLNATTQQTTATATSTEDNNTNKFRSADDPNGEKAKAAKNNTEDRKFIVNFYKAITTVLTAEMRTCNQVRRSCEQIVKNYINLQGAKTPQQNNKNQNTENTNNNKGINQVPIGQ